MITEVNILYLTLPHARGGGGGGGGRGKASGNGGGGQEEGGESGRKRMHYV